MLPQVPSQIGRYRIVGVVRQWVGPFQMGGWLYRGRCDIFSRDFWIKTLSSTATDSGSGYPEQKARFLREAKILSNLRHPNIITIFDVGEHEGGPYMALEGLDGTSLLESMNDGISLKAALPVILQVLDGLSTMHANGIIHRDIKPANIFICTGGPVKIIDFSIARVIHHHAPPFAATGMVIGTPSYMSPEQARGDAVDGRSDLFSVGCVLYEMVTGRRPFIGKTITGLLFKVITEEPDLRLIPQGPQGDRLRGVIARALQKRPEDRYPDADAMRADLESALKELGGSADWTPPLSGSPAPTRFH